MTPNLNPMTSILAVALLLGGLSSASPLPDDARPWDGNVDSAVASRIGPGTVLAIAETGADRRADLSGSPVQLNGCTANWLWKDSASPPNLYLGTSGHCVLRDGEADTADAADARVYACVDVCPFGAASGHGVAYVSPVGWVELGAVAYASQGLRTTDFALVRVSGAAEPYLNQSLKGWGGPVGVKSIERGDLLLMHGGGVAFGETFATKSRAGVFLSEANGVWRGNYPGSEGDSGSPVASAAGFGDAVHAVGIASFGDCYDRELYGVPDDVVPTTQANVQCVVSAVNGGVTIARAQELARAAGLCVEVVTVSENLASLDPAAACGA